MSFDSMQAPVWTAWGRGALARALIKLGEVEQAHTLLDPLWREGDNPIRNFFGFVEVGPAIAELALRDRRWNFGLEFCNWLLGRLEAEEALRMAGEMRYWRARLHFGSGDMERAKADLVQAQEWLDACEATVLLRQVEDLLAHLCLD